MLELIREENEILEKIKNGLELSENCDFGYDIDNDDTYGIDEILNDAAFEVPGTQVANGCSKGVLIPKNCKWVLKVPFFGRRESLAFDVYNEITEEWEQPEGEEDFYLYEGAIYLDEEDGKATYGKDYCFSEITFFNMARELGVDKFFAEARFFGKQNGYPTYIQEKCKTWENYDENFNKCSDNSFQKVKSTYSKNKKAYWFDEVWLGRCIDYYGEEELQNFIAFCELFPEVCSDMHSGNFGVRTDGSPCLIDYTGFRC